MRKKRWNTVRAALYGAIVGVLYGLLKTTTHPDADPDILLFAGNGDILVSAIGGSVLFALFSKARNIAVGV